MDTTVSTLTRYPIKGLSGQILHSVQLEAGKGFPNDRKFGFARPKSGFDPQNPRPLPKSKFYMLAGDASLALLSTEYDDDTGVLSIVAPQSKGQFDISNDDGKHDANEFLKTYLSLPTDETPHLYEASPHRFTDVSVVSSAMMNAVSIINLDSVSAFAKATGRDIDPVRFRGNIHLSGLTPFSELDMVGQQFTIGEARFEFVQRTKRCPATQVNPDTGERDTDVPELLHEHYGHRDMGVYAEVLQGGTISPGDTVAL